MITGPGQAVEALPFRMHQIQARDKLDQELRLFDQVAEGHPRVILPGAYRQAVHRAVQHNKVHNNHRVGQGAQRGYHDHMDLHAAVQKQQQSLHVQPHRLRVIHHLRKGQVLLRQVHLHREAMVASSGAAVQEDHAVNTERSIGVMEYHEKTSNILARINFDNRISVDAKSIC
jgi:hypothetical protein